MPIIYVLPMPSELYERDFDAASLGEYRQLLRRQQRADAAVVGRQHGRRRDASRAPQRDRQYAQLGCFIAAHCHILLALWDGNEDGLSGGTAAIIRYHQDDFMLGLTDGEPRSRLDDTDDESDLVYHIVCSRDRPDGAPTAPLRPGEVWWLSRNEAAPRTARDAGPLRNRAAAYGRIQSRRDAFSRSDRARTERVAGRTVPRSAIGAGARDIAAVFGVADWLSMHYRDAHAHSAARAARICGARAASVSSRTRTCRTRN